MIPTSRIVVQISSEYKWILKFERRWVVTWRKYKPQSLGDDTKSAWFIANAKIFSQYWEKSQILQSEVTHIHSTSLAEVSVTFLRNITTTERGILSLSLAGNLKVIKANWLAESERVVSGQGDFVNSKWVEDFDSRYMVLSPIRIVVKWNLNWTSKIS